MRLTLLSLFLIFSYSQAFAELSYVEMTCVEFEHIKETLDYTSDEDLDSDKMPDEGSSAEAVAIIEGYADEETRVEREEKVLFLVDSSYGKYGGCPTKVFENNTGYFESFGDFSTLNMNKNNHLEPLPIRFKVFEEPFLNKPCVPFMYNQKNHTGKDKNYP